MTTQPIDSVGFFDALATEMNAHPEVYDILGDVEMAIVFVMTRPGGTAFRAKLTFDGIQCTGVQEVGEGAESDGDCWVEGDVSDWQAMLDDIFANGQAEGRQTINSLTLLGDRLAVHGEDPMGVDRFFRFNQTVQNFLDGAANLTVPA